MHGKCLRKYKNARSVNIFGDIWQNRPTCVVDMRQTLNLINSIQFLLIWASLRTVQSSKCLREDVFAKIERRKKCANTVDIDKIYQTIFVKTETFFAEIGLKFIMFSCSKYEPTKVIFIFSICSKPR